jgi:hypothetical protein
MERITITLCHIEWNFNGFDIRVILKDIRADERRLILFTCWSSIICSDMVIKIFSSTRKIEWQDQNKEDNIEVENKDAVVDMTDGHIINFAWIEREKFAKYISSIFLLFKIYLHCFNISHVDVAFDEHLSSDMNQTLSYIFHRKCVSF